MWGGEKRGRDRWGRGDEVGKGDEEGGGRT